MNQLNSVADHSEIGQQRWPQQPPQVWREVIERVVSLGKQHLPAARGGQLAKETGVHRRTNADRVDTCGGDLVFVADLVNARGVRSPSI